AGTEAFAPARAIGPVALIGGLVTDQARIAHIGARSIGAGAAIGIAGLEIRGFLQRPVGGAFAVGEQGEGRQNNGKTQGKSVSGHALRLTFYPPLRRAASQWPVFARVPWRSKTSPSSG